MTATPPPPGPPTDETTDQTTDQTAGAAPASPADPGVERARGFALNEDWLATVVGLAIVVLAMVGLITESWLPL